jgi:hypothetical protein
VLPGQDCSTTQGAVIGEYAAVITRAKPKKRREQPKSVPLHASDISRVVTRHSVELGYEKPKHNRHGMALSIVTLILLLFRKENARNVGIQVLCFWTLSIVLS